MHQNSYITVVQLKNISFMIKNCDKIKFIQNHVFKTILIRVNTLIPEVFFTVNYNFVIGIRVDNCLLLSNCIIYMFQVYNILTYTYPTTILKL